MGARLSVDRRLLMPWPIRVPGLGLGKCIEARCSSEPTTSRITRQGSVPVGCLKEGRLRPVSGRQVIEADGKSPRAHVARVWCEQGS